MREKKRKDEARGERREKRNGVRKGGGILHTMPRQDCFARLRCHKAQHGQLGLSIMGRNCSHSSGTGKRKTLCTYPLADIASIVNFACLCSFQFAERHCSLASQPETNREAIEW